MNPWTEYQIGIVFFTGLIIALASSVLIFIYLQPTIGLLSKITGKIGAFWNRSFKISLLFVGLLGAMSVTFTDCSGSYGFLLDSKNKTIVKGLEQVSESFEYLTIVLGLWLFFFIALFLKREKNP
jgi:hypothetical protein